MEEALTVTDLQFLDGLMRNDEGVWAKFVARGTARIVEFAQSRWRLQAVDAQDLAQSVICAFCISFRKGRYNAKKGRLLSWLFGIARRRHANRKRSAARRREVQLTSESGPVHINEGAMNTTRGEYVVDLKLLLGALLQEAYQRVGDQTAAAFRLYVLEGKPASEVARLLDMTRNAVYLAKYHVMQRVRELAAEQRLF